MSTDPSISKEDQQALFMRILLEQRQRGEFVSSQEGPKRTAKMITEKKLSLSAPRDKKGG